MITRYLCYSYQMNSDEEEQLIKELDSDLDEEKRKRSDEAEEADEDEDEEMEESDEDVSSFPNDLAY